MRDDNIYPIRKPKYPDPSVSPEQNWMEPNIGENAELDDEGNKIKVFGPYEYSVLVGIPLAFKDRGFALVGDGDEEDYTDPIICTLNESYFYGVGGNWAGYEFLQLTLIEPPDKPPMEYRLANAVLAPYYGEDWEDIEDQVFAKIQERIEEMFKAGLYTRDEYEELQLEPPTPGLPYPTQSCLWCREIPPPWSPRNDKTTLNLMERKSMT